MTTFTINGVTKLTLDTINYLKSLFGGSDICEECKIMFDLEVITDRVTDLGAGGWEVFSKKFEYEECNVNHEYQ